MKTFNQTQKEWDEKFYNRFEKIIAVKNLDISQEQIPDYLHQRDQAIKQAVIEEIKAIIESAEVRPTDLLNIKNKKLAEETNEKLMPMLKKTLLTNLNNKE